MATQANPPASKTIPSRPAVVSKLEPQDSTNNEDQKIQQPSVSWDSEMQLVSSLWKLQELEKQIHQLRTLLPYRLLAPLVHITNPQTGLPVPQSPRMLGRQLQASSAKGVAEVEHFQAMWHSPEMKAIWDHVGELIKENGGQLLQPTGVWERDYDVLLEELVKEEQEKEAQRQREAEELERSQAQAAGGDWTAVVERFVQRELAGVQVFPDKNDASVMVALVKAGMTFRAQLVNSLEDNGAMEWRVSNKVVSGKPKTKLETAIADCLNGRSRKWDLGYLLDMITSYSEVKQTPCVKCNRMTDAAAQLPTLRQPTRIQSPEGQQFIQWKAYHAGCA